jgi:hypothetical protein
MVFCIGTEAAMAKDFHSVDGYQSRCVVGEIPCRRLMGEDGNDPYRPRFQGQGTREPGVSCSLLPLPLLLLLFLSLLQSLSSKPIKQKRTPRLFTLLS